MEKTVKIIKEYDIIIPDNMIQKHLNDYRSVINSNGNLNEMLEHIVICIAENRFFVEGIGKVSIDGHFTSELNEYDASDINVIPEDEYCEIDNEIII